MGNGSEIPEPYKNHIKSWHKNYPDWGYKLWRERDAVRFVKRCFPKEYKFWSSYELPISKCDVLRYMILYFFGGIYIDIDMYSYESLNKFLEENKKKNINWLKQPTKPNIILSEEWHKSHTRTNSLTNGFMVALEKKHPFWLDVIENAKKIKRPIKHITDIFKTTGTNFLSSTVKNYGQKYSDLGVVPCYYFMPFIFRTPNMSIDYNGINDVYLKYVDKASAISNINKKDFRIRFPISYSACINVQLMSWKKSLESPIPVYTNKKKIGILMENDKHLFTNGAIQQTYFTYKVIKNAGYDVVLMSNSKKRYFEIENIPVRYINAITEETVGDIHTILFTSSSLVQLDVLSQIKERNIKIISQVCGNYYIINQEDWIHGCHKRYFYENKDFIDEYWVLPMYTHMVPYLKAITKKNVIIAPYVWDGTIIDHFAKVENLDTHYKNLSLEKPNFIIAEPNLSVHKTSLIPLLITEQYFTKHYIDNVICLCCDRNDEWKDKFIKLLKISDRINCEKRIFLLNVLHNVNVQKKPLTFVSHHIYNDLNFLHLELLYLGYPLIHNSKRLQEVGYYYPEHNIEKGAEQLRKCVLEYQPNFEKIKEQNKKFLYNYDTTNPKVLERYREILGKVEPEKLRIKNILLIPTQGFANRLRAIVSAIILSKQINANLYINWDCVEECNIAFEDIFMNIIQRFDFKNMKKFGKIYFNENTHTEKYLNDVLNSGQFSTLLIRGGHEFKHQSISDKDYIEVKKQVYNNLILREQFVTDLEIFSQNYKLSKAIGIHYREYIDKYDKLDSASFEKDSPLKQFYKYMDKETGHFYISTTSDSVKKTLFEKYKDRVIFRENITSERNKKESMIDAVKDFFLLSKCSKIIGTHGSSFSDEACFMGNITKIMPYNKCLTGRYHCYGLDETGLSLNSSTNS